MLGQTLGLSRAHMRKGHLLLYNQLNLLYCLNQDLIHIMVANLYMLQNTEGNKSFLWHKQLNYNITEILQTWVNIYLHLNPAGLETNQSRIPCLSCCWKELVFLHVHVLRRKARTNFLYSMRLVVWIFAQILSQQKFIHRSYFWL